ncbi:GHKL domain-containing protein [uncultured Megasphaera sp.]|uniref:GHKL domain-containing protein n=1 Tax=uncultured Megasphaera sp. TaxID=165188 RepID=UPI0025FE9DBA|nr:GHKL domain-containing protein [uncultured Megasphaera sp.]
MLYDIMTVIIITLSIMPPAMLQYYAFEPLLTERKKRLVLGGYAVILLAELSFLLYMIPFGPWSHSYSFYKKLFAVIWIPHFIWAVAVIRPFLFRHLYVFSVRATLTIFIHTVLAVLLLAFFQDESRPVLSRIIYPAHFFFYTLCFTAAIPWLRRYFNEIFVKYYEISTHKYWKYVSLLPLFLILDMYLTMATSDILMMDKMLLPRTFLMLALILLAFSIRAGFRQADILIKNYERSNTMTAQIQTSRAYTRSLLQSQEEMKEIYKKRNGLLEELRVLIASHERQKALHLIEDIGTALNKTKRRQYCQNTLVNAALAMYLTRAEELKIPVTAHIVVPQERAGLSSDMAIVLSNLIENAIHASEKQPKGHQAISLLTLYQGDILSVLVKNRYDGQVILDDQGLPVTKAKGHGIGMKSLDRFRQTYDASVLCTYEDGWFSTYIRVPWGGAA